jgi:UDP-glucose 4-epimerase
MQFKRFVLVGGAGFIGSHFVDALLKDSRSEKVTIIDNFTTGKRWHYASHQQDSRLSVIHADVKNMNALDQAMADHDVVLHFASNSDISQAITNPSIDFTDGICLTYQVLESARKTGVSRILYFSGSGVYGDVGRLECYEDQGCLHPVSPYGASKLAGEAFISSYCHMFGMTACVFRFGNVVGPRQTHGVGYDFIRKLLINNTSLKILGNGLQSKSYVHVEDVVTAVLLANQKLHTSFEIYNVATGDYISVREIADMTVECMGLKGKVDFEYTGGDRGWSGDVPIVRLNTDKIRALGWRPKYNSAESMKAAILAMLEHAKSGLMFPECNLLMMS